MDKLTDRQKDIIKRARRYKNRWLAKPFRRYYQEVCTDTYISADDFDALVQEEEKSNILPFHNTQPTMEINEYLKVCESKLLGREPVATMGYREKNNGERYTTKTAY